jgi:hypothetical protein
MAAEKVAPTAGLDGKELNTTTLSQDATSTGSSGDEERAANDFGGSGEHVFSDPKVAEYWRGVYETARYECRHRFDPSATWTPEEEKKLKRRVSAIISVVKVALAEYMTGRFQDHALVLADVCGPRSQQTKHQQRLVATLRDVINTTVIFS